MLQEHVTSLCLACIVSLLFNSIIYYTIAIDVLMVTCFRMCSLYVTYLTYTITFVYVYNCCISVFKYKNMKKNYKPFKNCSLVFELNLMTDPRLL